ncbi:hypothetical protein [Denitratisoma oestradiolicum]|uniref:hypothetical protein n=1 Tax=Denitratisoma oestradiolicum TaxID=311182 RepID=UPI0011A2CF11|nr:hypothetical protein [Denitratisoma oestradiolicum]TWO81591.1 hypothetical protein CBW56_02430 [Denitratisoma oestradiolicum]
MVASTTPGDANAQRQIERPHTLPRGEAIDRLVALDDDTRLLRSFFITLTGQAAMQDHSHRFSLETP